MQGHTRVADAFPPSYLRTLRRSIRASPYFTVNTLNRDFVATRGFSVVFRRSALEEVLRAFPFFAPYLGRALLPDANAFYLNPLELQRGSRVDPHVDRSLRAYCPTVEPPAAVSVLYVEVPAGLVGGALVLQRGRKHLARVTPTENTLLTFEGDLTHSIEPVESSTPRLSLVCEQYCLPDAELERIPSLAIESRARAMLHVERDRDDLTPFPARPTMGEKKHTKETKKPKTSKGKKPENLPPHLKRAATSPASPPPPKPTSKGE